MERGREERDAKLAKIESCAAEQDLIPLSGVEMVWVRDGVDSSAAIPARFFTPTVVDEQVTFEEHTINVPLSVLAPAVKAVAEFYDRTENAVVLERRGIDGFVEFLLEKATAETT